jgi:integrase
MPRTTTKQGRFRWATGHRGQNRVLLYASPRTGALTLEWFEGSLGQWTRRYRSLGHTDRERGKREAEDLAEQLRHRGGIRTGGIVTLGALFDIYEGEVTPTKGKSSQSHERRAFRLFLRFWGRQRDAASMNIRDWNAYITARRSGNLAPRDPGMPVRDRIIEQDLTLLMTVFNWATIASDSAGGYLLDRNPFRGFKRPREINVVRPMLAPGQYEALLEASRLIDPRLELALVLCNETGHRLNSVRQLEWRDVDLEQATVLWRTDSDKMKREHKTPLEDAAVAALKAERQRQLQLGRSLADVRIGYVFPAVQRPDRPLDRRVFYKRWKALRDRYGGALPPRAGFHSLRRKFASEWSDAPTALVAAAGGWVNPEVVVKVYQRPSVEQLRARFAQVRQAR